MDYLSPAEKRILTARDPLPVSDEEVISVLGEWGVWINRQESSSWRGSLPLSSYPVNDDKSFKVISKSSLATINHIQELSIRYLQPPTLPIPGEIIIEEQPHKFSSPAPPVILRQQAVRHPTPTPLVIREMPPKMPPPEEARRIVISGKKFPPPPRKLIVERLAPMPEKPRPVIVERWLHYDMPKRRVIMKRPPAPPGIKQKNLIIKWNSPKAVIQKKVNYLGVIEADPVEYTQQYGSELKHSSQLPSIVYEIDTPPDLVLAVDSCQRPCTLHGDLEALKLIDLNKYGLGEYQTQLDRIKQTMRS